jgi:hypothetical protein
LEAKMDISTAKNESTGRSREGKNDEPSAQKEGPVARAIETQTAKLPSDIFLWAAGASIAISAAAQLIGRRRGLLDRIYPARAPLASFVGMWAPTFLLLGIYNKIVKVAGSDRASQ